MTTIQQPSEPAHAIAHLLGVPVDAEGIAHLTDRYGVYRVRVCHTHQWVSAEVYDRRDTPGLCPRCHVSNDAASGEERYRQLFGVGR